MSFKYKKKVKLLEFDIDITEIETPSYLIDEKLLIKNLKILKKVKDATNCSILLAQKGFSMYYYYKLIGKYLDGTTASSLHEAKLGYDEMGGEVHVFSPAFNEDEFDELTNICDHIVFNSFSQWDKYKSKVKNASRAIECGIRVNPEYAEVEVDLYNPCFNHSRLGVTIKNFQEDNLEGIDGIHFHTMCEQNSDVLERTLKAFEEKFSKYLYNMKWVNFGGGHHITRDDYDLDKLIKCILYIKNKYDVQVYLEPGEAVALNTGYLVAKVLDFVDNGLNIAILDTSVTCHMPDVLEMPYRPNIIGATLPNQLPFTYRLAGPSCLSGDVIGDYSFEKKLEIGDKIIFCDMAHYTMVKNNTFNGVKLPSIYIYNEIEKLKLIKKFSYEDFKNRLS